MNTAFKRLLEIAQVWSVDEALWVLQVYRYTREEICWRSFWTTPWDMCIAVDSSLHASEVEVKFWGGPDGMRVFTGSFLMFVIDRVLYRWHKDKVDWSWLLHFNCDTATHLEEQLKAYAPDCPRQRMLPGFGEEKRIDNSEFDEDPFHSEFYQDGERIVNYVQIGGESYPILESGRQGYVVKRGGETIPIRVSGSSAGSDNGENYRWTSSGRVSVCDEAR